MLKRTHIRVLSLLLVLSMMLSVMPASSAAAEQETPALPEEPLASAQVMETLVLDEQSVPEIVGLETARDRGHVLRLREEEQGQLNKLIFLNEDGSRTMYLYDHPVKYVDEKGTVRDISLEIADTGDAAQPFRTASGATVTTFSANLSGGITLSGNSNTLRLVPITSGRARTASRLDAQTIQYPYGTHTTIEYSLTYTGFKEDIVVSQYTGQTEYPFTLYTNGLTLTEIDGSWYLTDEKGDIQATIGDVIVFTADERNNTMGTMRAETVVPNQEYRMTIVLDPEYLADPNTVYPIRIDPTIDLNYEDDGADAILDMTLFSNGTSSITSGSLTVGNHETKGIARAVMSFPGLDLDEYDDISITYAKVYVRDLLCESVEQDIQCNIYTGTQWGAGSTGGSLNQTWMTLLSEVTFGYEIGYDFDPRHVYSFDITAAVRDWMLHRYDQAKGIIFRSSELEVSNTYRCRTLASYNRANYKPYLEVVFRYDNDGIVGVDHVVEGGSVTLSADPAMGNVTWRSTNTDVATIDSNGVVTGHKAGATTIIASAPDFVDAVYPFWVTIQDGVYFVRNAANSTLYLENSSNGIIVNTKKSIPADQPPQLWKISYISGGYYSIRPFKDTSLALCVANGMLSPLVTASEDYSLSPSFKWTINCDSQGYYFSRSGFSSETMQPSSGTVGAEVTADDWTSNTICHWRLEYISGLFLRDSSTKQLIDTSVVYQLTIGDSANYSAIDIAIECYGTNNDTVIWGSDNEEIASVRPDGSISAVHQGRSVISAIKVIDNTLYSASFSLAVTIPLTGYELPYEPERWNDVPVEPNTYVYQYTNCYAYALNNQIDPNGNNFGCNSPYTGKLGWHRQQPGEFYNANLSECENAITTEGYVDNPQLIVAAVAKDFEKYNQLFGTNLVFQPLASAMSTCPIGTYKIALCIRQTDNVDYHWYRQNSDGTWSHSRGDNIVKNVDDTSEPQVIYDPEYAAETIGYTFIGYYAITPWNNFYVPGNERTTNDPWQLSVCRWDGVVQAA